MGILGYLVGSMGLMLSLFSMWLVVKAPFFGLEVPTQEQLILGFAGFILGMLSFAWGVQFIAHRHGQSGRPDPDKAHDPTMDWIQR